MRKLTTRRNYLLIVIAAMIALLPMSALAHTQLTETSPADGEVVTGAVEEVTVTFADEIQPFSQMTVEGADGSVAEPDQMTVDGKHLTAVFDPPLAGGEYTVKWQVVAADGHTLRGEFAFAVEADEQEEEEAADADGAEGAADDVGDADDADDADVELGASDDASDGADGSADSSSNDVAASEGSGSEGVPADIRTDNSAGSSAESSAALGGVDGDSGGTNWIAAAAGALLVVAAGGFFFVLARSKR